jgi:oligoendopeptidase F
MLKVNRAVEKRKKKKEQRKVYERKLETVFCFVFMQMQSYKSCCC